MKQLHDAHSDLTPPPANEAPEGGGNSR
jgi:hypothetical protein